MVVLVVADGGLKGGTVVLVLLFMVGVEIEEEDINHKI